MASLFSKALDAEMFRERYHLRLHPPTLSIQHEEIYNRLQEWIKQIEEDTLKQVETYYAEQEKRFVFALRRLLPKPIKGKITKGKVSCRGIYLDYKLGTPLTNYPILCIRESKSGKRNFWMQDLNFESQPGYMAEYLEWCKTDFPKEKMILKEG